MQTKPKSSSVITHHVDGSVITFVIAAPDGERNVILDTAKVATELRERAMLHGFIQRISDAAAMSRDPATGKPATPGDKAEAMRVLVEHYASGTTEWNRKRVGGEKNEGGLLFKSLSILYPTKDIKAFLSTKSKQEKAALLATPKVKKIADDIRAAAAKSTGIDAEELLGGLDA